MFAASSQDELLDLWESKTVQLHEADQAMFREKSRYYDESQPERRRD